MTIVQHEAGPKFVECTPLWTSFLESLDGFGDNSDGHEILEFLSEKCFYQETLYLDDKGEQRNTALPLSWKMEVLLQKTIERRSMHIRHLMETDDERVRGKTMKELVNNFSFSDADMTTTMNTWRYNHSSWMKEEAQDKYSKCKTSKAVESYREASILSVLATHQRE